MIGTVRLTVEGLPEEIQWVTDALECSFPGAVHWHPAGVAGANNVVTVQGVGIPLVICEKQAA